MGCANCNKRKSGGVPKGCKSNGSCASGGCEKLAVFDWLSNMEMPLGRKRFDAVEVRFKNTRKAFYRNIHQLALSVGETVVVEANPGHDVGVVSAVEELAKIQMNKKKSRDNVFELRKVLRKAEDKDFTKWQEARKLEAETLEKAKKVIAEMDLKMKLSDVEYQGDKSKAIFYYTAEDRVDFRELIKKLAELFKLRIEMKQIGVRQEAGRLGGIGSCGRELCCSTWLTDFRTVSTSAARYQQLSLNPQKLAGQCGKLKCCLNYELDMYMEVVKELPGADQKIKTEKGIAVHFKTDIFRKKIWYVYENQEILSPIALSGGTVKRLLKRIEKGEKIRDLKDYEEVASQD